MKDKTKTTACRSEECGQEIAFTRTPRGKLMPVDAETLSDEDLEQLARGEEIIYRHGEHESHFNTCRDRKNFRTALQR